MSIEERISVLEALVMAMVKVHKEKSPVCEACGEPNPEILNLGCSGVSALLCLSCARQHDLDIWPHEDNIVALSAVAEQKALVGSKDVERMTRAMKTVYNASGRLVQWSLRWIAERRAKKEEERKKVLRENP